MSTASPLPKTHTPAWAIKEHSANSFSVVRNDGKFVCESPVIHLDFLTWNKQDYPICNMYNYRNLLQSINNDIYYLLVQTEGSRQCDLRKSIIKKFSKKDGKILQWSSKNTQKAISRILFPVWKRMVAEQEQKWPEPTRIAKRIGMSSGFRVDPFDSRGQFWFNQKLYTNDHYKYLVKDALKYWGPLKLTQPSVNWRQRVLGVPDDTVLTHAQNMICDHIPCRIPSISLPYNNTEEYINRLLNHMSNAGTLKSGLMIRVLFYLFELSYLRDNKLTLDTIAKCNTKEFTKAFKKFKKDKERYAGKLPKLTLRSSRSIREFIGYLLDYPDGDKHTGKIMGLYEKSHRWHIEERERMINLNLAKMEMYKNEKTVEPPIPAPNAVKFLPTVYDLMLEGKDMGHCVGSYGEAAMSGRSYIFHYDHKDGTKATVEFCPRTFRVVQARGPYNVENSAAKAATNILNRWGLEVKKKVEENDQHRNCHASAS